MGPKAALKLGYVFVALVTSDAMPQTD